MMIRNINRTTILFNLLFLFILISYFYIDMSDKQKPIKLKKDKLVVSTSIDPTHNLPKINIETVKLPKVQLPKVQQTSNNVLKVKTKKILLPIKYVKQSLPIDFKVLSQPKLSNNKSHNDKKIVPIKYENKSFKTDSKYSLMQIKPIKYENKSFKTKSKYASTQIKLNNYKKEQIKYEQKENIKKNIKIGRKILENATNFQLEFLWPFNTLDHDKIYKILNQCLQSKTVLMDNNEMIFGLNGKIDRETLNNKFSKIIRVPTHVHSSIEKNKIKNIQSKFLKKISGKHLRLYRKNIDAYIIGFYLNLAKNNQISIKNIKKIKGKYSLINNELFLDNLMINSFTFKDKILLSSLGKTCSI
jgi:hypothetical protein